MNPMKAGLVLVGAVGVGFGGAALYSSFVDAPDAATNEAKSGTTATNPDVEYGVQAQDEEKAQEKVADAQSTAPILCDGKAAPKEALSGNRIFGHFAYAEASASDLVAPPSGFGGPNCPTIHSSMAPSLKSMLAAAAKDDPQIGKAIMGISCFRSIERQRGLFCNPGKIAARGLAGQAKWVAPPGYSEHATGLTIDFGARTIPECHTNPCFAETKTGKWLKANASKFGFEMSFPAGNAQGVSHEPWHFRWAGDDGAAKTFSEARSAFPAP